MILYGDISINPVTREAAACGHPLKLTAKEFELLAPVYPQY